MATGTKSSAPSDLEPAANHGPEIAVCESSPTKSVFIESGNTDGWISSDLVVDVSR